VAANTSLSSLARKHVVVRYAAAFVVLAVALEVGRITGPVLGAFVPYALAFLAVAFSSWYCGLGPSIVITILTLAALKFWTISPVQTFRVASLWPALGMLIVLAVCGLIIAMGEARRRENEAFFRGQQEMELRVQERTAELDKANRGLSDLTARLMRLQDEERRRIAREMHDSIGQTLAALNMNLTRVGADIERLGQTAKTVRDSLSLTQEVSKEVRTVSYLLHPPLLDESGLASALEWYVPGFAERSQIQVDLDVPEDFGRLPQEIEMALFRTVQECLTNIHRHSGSKVARIQLARSAKEIRLKVEDRGTGIPAEKLENARSDGTPGVGIRGMRERIRQLEGTLTVHSSPKGTTVEVTLPLKQAPVAAPPEVAA
jgi:signal transduction histidine kinase